MEVKKKGFWQYFKEYFEEDLFLHILLWVIVLFLMLMGFLGAAQAPNAHAFWNNTVYKGPFYVGLFCIFILGIFVLKVYQKWKRYLKQK